MRLWLDEVLKEDTAYRGPEIMLIGRNIRPDHVTEMAEVFCHFSRVTKTWIVIERNSLTYAANSGQCEQLQACYEGGI